MNEKRYGGNLPVLKVEGENIPEAWEKAVIAVWEQGVDIRTEYDRKDKDGNFIDPPSKDATVMVVVKNPFAEPRIHKNFPGGPAELEVYRQEVVKGIHDHWVDPSDPDKWTYTYHKRLTAHQPTDNLEDPNAILKTIGDRGYVDVTPVNQLDYIVEKLSQSPYSRRAQATTWMPTADPQTDDSPCLQRLWCRIFPDEKGNLVLNANTYWRSRDLYKAWFMNAFAITDLIKGLSRRIGKRMGKKIKVGRYCDTSDSLHIYGAYFKDFKSEYEKMKENPDYHLRTWPSNYPAVQVMFEETRRMLKKNPDFMKH